MFGRNDNLKRAIALLGVMLALSSGAQHVRLFCHVAGCHVAEYVTSAVGVEQCFKQESSSKNQCSHSQPCETTQALIVVASQNGCTKDEGGSCPCPSGCWCHHAPAPMELPKSNSELSLLVLLGIGNLDAASIETIDGNRPLQGVSTAALESSVLSASQRCAQLCRFLI